MNKFQGSILAEHESAARYDFILSKNKAIYKKMEAELKAAVPDVPSPWEPPCYDNTKLEMLHK